MTIRIRARTEFVRSNDSISSNDLKVLDVCFSSFREFLFKSPTPPPGRLDLGT